MPNVMVHTDGKQCHFAVSLCSKIGDVWIGLVSHVYDSAAVASDGRNFLNGPCKSDLWPLMTQAARKISRMESFFVIVEFLRP